MIEQLRDMEKLRQEMRLQAMQVAFEKAQAAKHNCDYEQLKANLDKQEAEVGSRYLIGFSADWAVWQEAWQAAQEQMLREQAEEAAQPNAFLSAVSDVTMKLSSGDYALVPKKEVCDFYVANHLKGTSCSVDVSNLTGNDGDRIYGKLLDYDCIGSDGNTLIYALESSNFKLAKNKGNSGDYVLVTKDQAKDTERLNFLLGHDAIRTVVKRDIQDEDYQKMGEHYLFAEVYWIDGWEYDENSSSQTERGAIDKAMLEAVK